MQKILDALTLIVKWYLTPPQYRPQIIYKLRHTVARAERQWQFYPTSIDHCIIGQSTAEIEHRARTLGLTFLAIPSALIFTAAAFGIPGSHLMILSVALSLASVWMLARIKVQRLSMVENR